MKYRIFGKTGFNASEIGLGCWQIGSCWGNIPEQTAEKILNTAYDNGTNFYDTADVYGNGRSEKLVGRFIRGKSDVFVATKVGRSDSLYPNNFTIKAVTACIDGSLKRLGLESLDLIQLHCVPPDVLKQGDILDLMQTKKGRQNQKLGCKRRIHRRGPPLFAAG